MRFFLLSQPIDRGHNRLMINEWKPLNPQTNLLHIRQVRSEETMSLCHIGNADRVPCPTPVREKRSNSSIMRIGGKRNVSLLWLASPDKLILETMTTKATDFKQTMTSEIGSFIESQARAVSIADINRLIVDLPALRERFAKIPARHIPIWQTSFNCSPSWSRSRSFETPQGRWWEKRRSRCSISSARQI